MGSYETSEPEGIFDVISWPQPLHAEIHFPAQSHFLDYEASEASAASRPLHTSLLPSQSSRSFWLCWAPRVTAGFPISWKEISKCRLEFSEELPESCDFPKSCPEADLQERKYLESQNLQAW